MKRTTKARPLVPGLHVDPVTAATGIISVKGGAKNLQAPTSCPPKQTLFIGTFNVRTLSTEDRILELEEALKQLKWDILGLSETRLIKEDLIRLKSGNYLFYHGHETDRIGGVGILIKSS